jgi:acetylglutamate kinase
MGEEKLYSSTRKVITSLRPCGRRPLVVYGHRCVTIRDVMRARAGDQCGQLSSV